MDEPVDTDRGTGGQPEHVVNVTGGSCIFEEGEAGNEMFIIQSGRVAILKKVGASESLVTELDEGDFFGETAILEDQPRPVTARAVSDCSLLRIDRTTFDQVARRDPEVPIRMLRLLSGRLRRLVAQPGFASAAAGAVAVPDASPARPSTVPSPGAARLLHPPTGQEFALPAEGEAYVGRADPVTGARPDIELRHVDPHQSVSRRHACIAARDDRYMLREEIGVTNGTHVNDTPIEAGKEIVLRDGDRIRFGLVELVFHAG